MTNRARFERVRRWWGTSSPCLLRLHGVCPTGWPCRCRCHEQGAPLKTEN